MIDIIEKSHNISKDNVLIVCSHKKFISNVLSFSKRLLLGKTLFLFPVFHSTSSSILIEHLLSVFKDIVKIEDSCAISDRSSYYSNNTFIIVSPSLLYNDVLRNLINLNDIKTIVIFEAEKAIGAHALVKLTKILFNANSNVSVIALSNYLFYESNKLQEVCANLRIMRIVVDPIYLESLNKRLRKRVVPLTRHFFEIVNELNIIKEQYLSSFGKDKALSIELEQDYKTALESLKKRKLDYITHAKISEYLLILKLKSIIESEGLEPAIKFLERKLDKDVNAKNNELSATSLFYDLKVELNERIKESEHPKIEVLKGMLTEIFAFCTHVSIIVNRKETAKMLERTLKNDTNYAVFNLIGKSAKKKQSTIVALKSEKNVLYLTSQFLPDIPFSVFYSMPMHYSIFLNAITTSQKVLFLLTHRTFEEKLFYKFISQLGKINELLEDTEINQLLLQNQQKYYHIRVTKKFDPKTRTMIRILKDFKEMKSQKQPTSSQAKEDIISEIRFIANIAKYDAERLLSFFNIKSIEQLLEIQQSKLMELFGEARGREIYTTIKKRISLFTESYLKKRSNEK